MRTRRAHIPIVQLRCGGAVDLERRLARVPGVLSAYVNPLTETAYFTYDPDRCDTGVLIDVLTRMGYRTGTLTTG